MSSFNMLMWLSSDNTISSCRLVLVANLPEGDQ
jgi:hypothetical protein